MIAAALSIQDPRERPAEQRAQADQAHARFAAEDSDFLAFWNLWRHLREGQRELSGSQFRKRCRAEYLHYLRVREWQDLVAQLRAAAKSVGIARNRVPAEPREIHVALLSGLLSHVGVKDAAGAAAAAPTRAAARSGSGYTGARGARFAFPASALARKPPAWVMVAELVETSRLWGRVAARIEPEWIEPLAGAPRQAHLRRAALGAQARLGRRAGARDALRAADRERPQGGLREHRARARARAVHPPRARGGRLGDAPRVLPRQPRAARGGRGARAPRAPARHPRRRRGALRLLRRAHPGGRRLGRALRPLVARRAAASARTCSTSRPSCSSPRTPPTRSTRAPGRRSGARAT